MIAIKELLMKKLCFIFLVASTSYGGYVYSSPNSEAQYITDKMIVEIASKTLVEKDLSSRFGRDKLEKRSVEVKNFLDSMGGANWYRNYLNRFGAPITVEELKTATLIGLFERKLGYYYIRRFPASVESMTVWSCNPSTNDRQVFLNFEDNPTAKAQCALSTYDAAIAFNDTEALKKFSNLAQWFLLNHVDGQWQWSFDLPSRDLKAPWISALTQSQGISVLLREYQLSNDQRYLDVATRALKWLRQPLEEGGLSKKMSKGVFYEEYPNIEKPSHVLNGHMSALFGLWDFYRVTGDEIARTMFDDGVLALREELSKYDVNCWSVYSQGNSVDWVTGAYQQFIIEQLRVIHSITSDRVFDRQAQKWEKCLVADDLFVQIVARDFLKSRPSAQE